MPGTLPSYGGSRDAHEALTCLCGLWPPRPPMCQSLGCFTAGEYKREIEHARRAISCQHLETQIPSKPGHRGSACIAVEALDQRHAVEVDRRGRLLRRRFEGHGQRRFGPAAAVDRIDTRQAGGFIERLAERQRLCGP